MPQNQPTSATDADIQEIVAKGEAGIGDVMKTYESLERSYVAAAAASHATVTVVTTNTTLR